MLFGNIARELVSISVCEYTYLDMALYFGYIIVVHES